jgi:nicotinamidase/pyrazinamidase
MNPLSSPVAALLLIDLQNDFCPGGKLAVKDGDQTIKIANKLTDQFGLVVASQDWHPENHGSFALVAERPLYSVFDLNGLPQVAWPTHCVQGFKGADFHPALDTNPIAAIFRKGMDPEVDSYSAFFDNAKRNDTGLNGYLKGKGVDTIYLMGLATDYCVKFTALDARALGYTVVLIEDGCRAVNVNPNDAADAVAAMADAGVIISTSADVEKGILP